MAYIALGVIGNIVTGLSMLIKNAIIDGVDY